MSSVIYSIDPVPKPRMTQRDKWSKRNCVTRYWVFKDLVKEKNIKIPPGGGHVIFYIPMPQSWSAKKRAAKDGAPHEQRPDLDNYLKALLDSVYSEDSHIYDIRASKFWAKDGAIEVTES